MREKTKHVGVYARKHSTRRHMGRQDICYDITYKDTQGKKVWLKVGWISEGITAQMASNVRGEKMREIRGMGAHQNLDGKRMTFAMAYDMYAKEHLPKSKSPEFTHKQYKIIEKHLADVPIGKITAYDIDKIISAMQGQGYSAQTIKHAIGLVQRVFNKLIAWGMYAGNSPTKGCTLPRIDSARMRYLTQAEAAALLDAVKAKSHTWYCISFISLNTGMRLGEILSLTWPDVDFESKTIHVRDAKAGTRMVIMTEDVKGIFTTLKSIHGESAYIFAARGQSSPPNAASKTFARCVESLGLNAGITDRRQKVVFHTLRHTFASWLAIRGIPLYVISQLLGHKSLEMTQRYAHLCPDVKRGAVEMLEGLLTTHK